MKLAAVCCTYNRPSYLGELIQCFLHQDYPAELRELVILDDAGQYGQVQGDGWKIISTDTRFTSLGEKRNACAALVSPDTEGLLVADDDDIYLPHWFSAHAAALKKGEWSCPSAVYTEQDGLLKSGKTGGYFHGSHAFRRSTFRKMRGYAAIDSGEDVEFYGRLRREKVTRIDPCVEFPPYYIYRFRGDIQHISAMGDDGYHSLGESRKRDLADFSIGWKEDYRDILFKSTKKHRKRIQLVHPVLFPGRDGPSNGMFALQKALKEIGSDILEIAPMPLKDDCIPWFWFCSFRETAANFAKAGMPFIQGPNMLFDYSFTPRAGEFEAEILDAKECLLHITHPGWYADHVRNNLGTESPGNMFAFPYPISPIPDGPEEAEYDLLVYEKGEGFDILCDIASKSFGKSMILKYGHYDRENLFEIARKSKACLYLCNDESGGLAAQEIMLSGCPILGIRRGCPLIIEGKTGLFLDKSADHETFALTPWVSIRKSIERLHEFDRNKVRECAMEAFDAKSIAESILQKLGEVL